MDLGLPCLTHPCRYPMFLLPGLNGSRFPVEMSLNLQPLNGKPVNLELRTAHDNHYLIEIFSLPFSIMQKERGDEREWVA
jgi:hypothetical protein